MADPFQPPAPLQVLIVDDEPLARLRLRQLLADGAGAAGLNLSLNVQEAAQALQAIDCLRAQPVDLVLLDIRMPGQDGLQLAATLRALPAPPQIVFVTAHAEHALQAFELQALDYLTKPVQAARLRQLLQRVAALRAPRPIVPAPAPQAAAAEPRMLLIQDRQRVLRIPLDEIVMARAHHKQVTLSTLTRQHLLDQSLAELEPQLGPSFVRVHRNAIVARHAVRELRRAATGVSDSGWALRVMPGEVWVPVSRRLLAAVRATLRQH
ncbi:MAG: response regulator transcription factor [Rubrivivax sp.]|nr:response regulator transcription factor [Rubrivivax sp.]